MFKPGQDFAGELSLRRWTVNTDSGKVRDDIAVEHPPGELPTRDPRVLGRKHRYGYFVQTRDSAEAVDSVEWSIMITKPVLAPHGILAPPFTAASGWSHACGYRNGFRTAFMALGYRPPDDKKSRRVAPRPSTIPHRGPSCRGIQTGLAAEAR